MRTKDLIDAIRKLPPMKRIFLVEQTMRMIRLDAGEPDMNKAARLLAEDYRSDKELTAFPALDGEDFYEPR